MSEPLSSPLDKGLEKERLGDPSTTGAVERPGELDTVFCTSAFISPIVLPEVKETINISNTRDKLILLTFSIVFIFFTPNSYFTSIPPIVLENTC
ncbi:MAG: hypothetical protein ACFFCZ_20985 [Promethearchaeota archaeon]